MTEPRITVVGSFAVGMTIRTPVMPIFGETLRGSDFDMGPGGKGSNQAVGTARLGARSALVGLIGEDKLGEIAIDLYAQEGIDTTFFRRTAQRPTGVGFIILNPAGENFIILDMAANELLDAAFVDQAEAHIAASAVVMSVLEIPVAAAARAMQLGQRHGVTTILNPAPAAALPPDIFQYIDVLTPNETELRILMGLKPDDPTPTRDLAQQLKARGITTLIVTQGPRGALVFSGDDTFEVPGVAVPVVDTTGAGDAFNSGLAVALAEGRPLRTAVEFGCCAGALACTRLGVIPALATRADVEKLHRQHYA
ncbi:MAG: ribokinase [Anaerolineae bacterium]|jgi:ribokinase|nr:ribokinase [Anaerolineae bacterium]